MAGTKESAAKTLATKLANQRQAETLTSLRNGTAVIVNTPRERVYHGRKGVVETHNLGEVGIDFSSGNLVWFRPDQLVRN